MDERYLKLFILNNAAVYSGLDRALNDSGLKNSESRDKNIDIDKYVDQFPLKYRIASLAMADNYRLFYLLENELRDFIE
ncbi:MAG: hypothetical protein Q8S29_15140, partial [Phreatobacter sp.]|nr:hypothetical protein [Phreatobacter sp.]